MIKVGLTLRNMGTQSTAPIMRDAVLGIEEMGFESVWITDHIAIPPDDAEGSGGRYTDPMTTLAWLGGLTTRINVGVGVLVVPYRPGLPLAKQIATVQELTDGRLLVGAAVGWMDAEFRALGLDRHQRGKMTDDTLELLKDCFADDVVVRNDQPFLFKPRPPMPPVYIGGSAPHALKRAVRFGHGWLPMARNLERLEADMASFREIATAAGKQPGPVTVMTGATPDEVADRVGTLEGMGVERVVLSVRYDTASEYLDATGELAARLELSA